MKMKDIFGNSPVFLAPMAGITDSPFRSICKELGADVLITEMVSTRGLYYNDKKTEALLYFKQEEHPVGVQLFGNDPYFFQEAIRKIEDKPFDFININMGCPTPKIVKNGDGSALMKNPELAAEIVKKTVSATNKPVSVKIRKGWDENSINAVEFSQCMEESGASMIIIHGRTREQFYSGKADWDIIRKVKQAIRIPVIGNGDIFSAEEARSMIETTGCDGIMVGRGAMGNPWIFREIQHYMRTGQSLERPTPEERLEIMLLHIERALEFHGERLGILEMRKHLGWYLKGLPHSAPVKQEIQKARDENHIRQVLSQYFAALKNS